LISCRNISAVSAGKPVQGAPSGVSEPIALFAAALVRNPKCSSKKGQTYKSVKNGWGTKSLSALRMQNRAT
jgi:hypothetical protein